MFGLSKKKVFVCYSRQWASGDAHSIVEALTRRYGKITFFDIDSVHAGEKFESKITQQITSASIFILLVTPQWLEDRKFDQQEARAEADGEFDYVMWELQQAQALWQENKLTVIPVLLGFDHQPPPDFTRHDSLQWLASIDFLKLNENKRKEGFKQLANIVGKADSSIKSKKFYWGVAVAFFLSVSSICSLLGSSAVAHGAASWKDWSFLTKKDPLARTNAFCSEGEVEAGWYFHGGENRKEQTETVLVFVHGLPLGGGGSWGDCGATATSKALNLPRMLLTGSMNYPLIYLASNHIADLSDGYTVNSAAKDLFRELSAKSIGPKKSVGEATNQLFIAHGIGGLIVREMLSEFPEYADNKAIGLHFISSPCLAFSTSNEINQIRNYLRHQFDTNISLNKHDVVNVHQKFSQFLRSGNPNVVHSESNESSFARHFVPWQWWPNKISTPQVSNCDERITNTIVDSSHSSTAMAFNTNDPVVRHIQAFYEGSFYQARFKRFKYSVDPLLRSIRNLNIEWSTKRKDQSQNSARTNSYIEALASLGRVPVEFKSQEIPLAHLRGLVYLMLSDSTEIPVNKLSFADAAINEIGRVMAGLEHLSQETNTLGFEAVSAHKAHLASWMHIPIVSMHIKATAMAIKARVLDTMAAKDSFQRAIDTRNQLGTLINEIQALSEIYMPNRIIAIDEIICPQLVKLKEWNLSCI